MTTPTVRDATVDDLPQILWIHNDAIAHTTAIWDDEQVDLADRAAWLHDRQSSGRPVLVAEAADGSVAGYASYGPWRTKSGYRHSVENSVYVHPDHRRAGHAATLVTALIDHARGADVHAIVAGIEAGNASSIALHERFGFGEVARMPQVGVKFGRWLDLVYLQLLLD